MNDYYSRNIIVPRYFFITSGSALSKVSKLNAFDKALLKAGLGQYNLVPVSSIIPPNAKLINPIKLPIGSIVFVVMARTDGDPSEVISAGLAWGWIKSKDGNIRHGIIVEGHGNKDKEALKESLLRMCNEMANARDMILEKVDVKIESISIPNGYYGSVIVAAVLIP